MEVQSQTNAVVPQSSVTVNRADASSALSSDFETFLLMLTTQMENQDPLNPIESQDFAVQLATFSGVEQQVQTNQLLQDLAGSLGASGVAQLAGWVGMEARTTGAVAFDGAPITLAPEPAPGADAAMLVVKDQYGVEVSRVQVPLGQDTIEWAGVGANGAPLPSGKYALELESRSAGELLATASVASYGRITEARQGLDGVELVLSGGIVVPSENVTALREPDGN